MAVSRTITIEGWDGPWADDDRDANFKHEISLYAQADPLATITALGEAVNVPPGAIAHYVLAKWASEGAAGILELGPTMVDKLLAACQAAEDQPDDEHRLAAYRGVAQRIAWLHSGTD